MTEPQDFPVYPSDPAPREPATNLPATPPPRTAAAGHLVGQVDGSVTRVESHGHERSSETVLSFRLLAAGDRPVEVELRGLSLSGSVRDGDWVEVPDQRRDGRIEVVAAANLTTGAQVRAIGSPRSAGVRVARIVFIAVFVAILIGAVVIGWQVFQDFRDFQDF